MMVKSLRGWAVLLLALSTLWMLTLSGGRPALAADRIVVGSKIDTEGALLGNILVLMLEKGGFQVESKVQLGNTKIVRTALLAGEIDVYPEYTGNAGFFFNDDSDPVWKDPKAGYEKARQLDLEKNHLVWLTPAPANNTWAIAVREDLAKKQTLKTMDDFARYVSKGGTIKLAGSAEFVESAAALPAFQKAYGFKLDQSQLLVFSGGGTAATIKAAAEGTSGVNAAMVYGTDGQIPALGLVVMEDTKNVEPVYRPAPVVRESVLKAHPAIEQLLKPAFEGLTLETLQKLNAEIAIDGKDAKAVAREYLNGKHLL